MTTATSHTAHPHLTLVPELVDAAIRLGRLEQAAGVDPITADTLDRLAELDANHATALDVFGLDAADIHAARKELTEAACRLADAEERFARAGIVVDETNRAVIDARELAGVAPRPLLPEAYAGVAWPARMQV